MTAPGSRPGTLAFVGLGVMGSPMAIHLQRAGYAVRGYNRTVTKAAELVRAGGKGCASIAEAVTGADVVCLMVPASEDVQRVLLGAGGVVETASPGTVVIDFSSIRPEVARDLAERGARCGLRMVDAPVSGGEAGAVEATLSIMVGGVAADVEAARPVLETVGQTVVHVGASGSGQTVKAANQLIVAANLQVLAEAVVFLEAYGVDLDAALEVLGGGLAGSAVLDQKRDNLRERSFAPGARMALHHKDLGAYADAARAAGVVSLLGALVTELMASAIACGDHDLDHAALIRGVDRLNGHALPTD
ncbi:MAG: NAD(P)-binding domain-containing protein [Ornithinimicrobium sp.]|uniref:NAD(P)-dependent oxidoreductase n=1 Tax=Ornithinimicrobium sp. TaxID=1977084 RepID=UPI0026DFE28D|nr:NAD(P)-binding domain-containing protein [Ornithinimicrobium sp.]MDO5740215.1 NAD(P)-binding domain-containing protein [Ornithinimicrobium sp.]